ncbi:MAG: DUF4112 domain-containing protein [Blastocatellia bacterium]|nr:DUF4112 domain-containing protein [Blastocatellia bacterium]
MKQTVSEREVDRIRTRMAYDYSDDALARPEETSVEPVDKRLERLAFILDQAIRIPGTNIRFGLDPIISMLAPVVGDSITTLLSVYIVIASIRYGLPKGVIARMVFNVAVDYLIGTVPAVGDLFDFAWKANSRNMKLLERHASGDGQSKWSDWAWLFLLLGGLGILILGLLAVILFALQAAGIELI